jgi:uncharacterized protein YceK
MTVTWTGFRIVLMTVITLTASGCAFLQEATRYNPPDADAVRANQDPCAGQQDYWGCRQAMAADRANRLSTFNSIYNASQAPAFQPAPRPVNTNCTPTYGGGMNCTSY